MILERSDMHGYDMLYLARTLNCSGITIGVLFVLVLYVKSLVCGLPRALRRAHIYFLVIGHRWGLHRRNALWFASAQASTGDMLGDP